MKHPRQQGFSILSAIFLVVVLGGLAGYMVSMSAVQQHTGSLSLLEAQTWQAARAGLERAARAERAAGQNGGCEGLSQGSFSLTLLGGMSFNVELECEVRTLNEAGGGLRDVYLLRSRAWTGAFGAPDYVDRAATLRLTTP